MRKCFEAGIADRESTCSVRGSPFPRSLRYDSKALATELDMIHPVPGIGSSITRTCWEGRPCKKCDFRSGTARLFYLSKLCEKKGGHGTQERDI